MSKKFKELTEIRKPSVSTLKKDGWPFKKHKDVPKHLKTTIQRFFDTKDITQMDIKDVNDVLKAMAMGKLTSEEWDPEQLDEIWSSQLKQVGKGKDKAKGVPPGPSPGTLGVRAAKKEGDVRKTIEKEFLPKLQKLVDKTMGTGINKVKVELKYGRKFAKVIKQSVNVAGRSVHSFIDLGTGDIYKAATWNAPAKHSRGSIFDKNNGVGTAVSAYGAKYLR